MAVFIELTTDIFSKNFDAIDDGQRRSGRAGSGSVRRPLRGIEVKEDTYAIMKVVDVSGAPLRMFDTSSRDPLYPGEPARGTEYANFLLQSVLEARMEKNQIVETFGESYIFFFGEAPRFIDVSAILINSNDFNWEAEFWGNYDNFWRGSRLTELGARLYLFYDDTIVEGYMLQAQAQKDSNNPNTVNINFRLFVTNYTNVSFVDSDDFPIRSTIDASMVGNLSSASGASILNAINNLDALERGLAQKAATLAIQKAAISNFGGGGLLAEALRRGVPPGMGPMLGGGAGIGISASVGASAGIGVGVGAQAGVAAGITAGAFAGAGVGPVLTSGSYPGFSPTGFPQPTLGSVTGPAGQGNYVASAFYQRGNPALPFAGAPIGVNPFAPNPFAPRPFAPNAFGVNPYYPNPFAPTPFNPNGLRQPPGTRSNLIPTNPYAGPGQQLPAYGWPKEAGFGPTFSPFPQPAKKQAAKVDPGLLRITPLRGKIWENVDEWTGASPQNANADFTQPPAVTDVEDLPYAAFLLLGAYGVGLNGFATLGAFGMNPKFSQGGVGIGAGARASASASFGVSAGVSASVGFSASASAGASAGFGVSASAGASAGIGPGGPYAGSYSNVSAGPLAAGGSPYPNYPGYGAGFGSGLPGLNGGYAPGARLGVGTSARVGVGASFGGGIGSGGAVMVGGVPTCFALDSFPGTLLPFGNGFLAQDGSVTMSSFTYGPDGATFTQRTL